MANFTTESFIISRTLCRIGHSGKIRRFRQNTYKILATTVNSYMHYGENSTNLLFAGSKAEGLTSMMESDIDIMSVIPDVLCLEYPDRYCNTYHKTIFQLKLRRCSPGYALLGLATTRDIMSTPFFIEDSLVEIVPRQFYLSSDFWKHYRKQDMTDTCSSHFRGYQDISNENHGPSTVSYGFQVSCDNVFAFTCECPSYMQHWVRRERKHHWPSAELIREVSNLESHVVPVGTKDGPLQFLEWRICYTKGEVRLIQSLNDCLMKVLILLKSIAKATLLPLCKEMSSYLMKNTILWIAEMYPLEAFAETNLISVLQFAFKFLKQCLFAKNLPSYMIPERNLLADRLTSEERNMLCMRIDCLLKEGPRVVLRAKTLNLRGALSMLYRTPDEFKSYHEIRNNNEIACLMLLAYGVSNNDPAIGFESMVRKFFADNTNLRLFRWMQSNLPEVAEAMGDDFLKFTMDDILNQCRQRD